MAEPLTKGYNMDLKRCSMSQRPYKANFVKSQYFKLSMTLPRIQHSNSGLESREGLKKRQQSQASWLQIVFEETLS